MKVYHGDFTCWADVEREFVVCSPEDGKVVLHASYDYEDYSGSATVLWFQDGRFYLVEGSHCSCYGLEGQFLPEETPLEAVLHLACAGKFHRGEPDLSKVLRALQADWAHAE
jgi:hypothetical protein